MFKKMLVTLALGGLLVGFAGAPSPASAAVANPGTVAEEMLQKDVHKLPPEIKEALKSFREEIKQEREKTRSIIEELRQDRAKLRELVKQAKQNGEKEKLELLKPLKVEADAIKEATGELRSQKKQAWEDLITAVRNGNLERVRELSVKILEQKKHINYNLQQLDLVLERAIAILD